MWPTAITGGNYPLRPEQVTDKARTLLLASGWCSDTAQALVDQVWALPQSSSMDALWAFLQMRVHTG